MAEETGWWKVVNTPALYIFTGPSVTYKRIGSFHPGTIIEEIGSHGDWIKHVHGWSLSYDTALDKDYLVPVQPPHKLLVEQERVLHEGKLLKEEELLQKEIQLNQQIIQQKLLNQQGQQLQQTNMIPNLQQPNMIPNLQQPNMIPNLQQPPMMMSANIQPQMMTTQPQVGGFYPHQQQMYPLQQPLQGQEHPLQFFQTGEKISLKSASNHYLGVDYNNNSHVGLVKQPYVFTLVAANKTGGWGLLNAFGEYVEAQANALSLGSGHLTFSKKLGEQETFYFVNAGSGTFAIQTCHKNLSGVHAYVVDSGKGTVIQAHLSFFGPQDAWHINVHDSNSVMNHMK